MYYAIVGFVGFIFFGFSAVWCYFAGQPISLTVTLVVATIFWVIGAILCIVWERKHPYDYD